MTPGTYVRFYVMKKDLVTCKVIDENSTYATVIHDGLKTINKSEIVEVMPEGWEPPMAVKAENQIALLFQFLQWLDAQKSHKQLVQEFWQWRKQQ